MSWLYFSYSWLFFIFKVCVMISQKREIGIRMLEGDRLRREEKGSVQEPWAVAAPLSAHQPHSVPVSHRS